mgnify:CR=1 FL=1
MNLQEVIYPNLVDSLDRTGLKQSYINQQTEVNNIDQNKKIPKKDNNTFRIVTYNVYGFNLFKNSADQIKSLLYELSPDVVGFQEFNNHFNMDGYKQFYIGTMTDENLGLGILNSYKWDKWSQYISHHIRKDGNTVWYDWVKQNNINYQSQNDRRAFVHQNTNIKIGSKVVPLNIINVHLDVWDESAATRFYEVNQIVQYIQKHRLNNVILMGDFNDVNLKLLPETLSGELELNFRRRFGKMAEDGIPQRVFKYLYDVGFVDSSEYINRVKNMPIYSCWSSRKVDHILVYKPTWNMKIKGLYVHYNNYSDHLPLIMDLEIN